MELKEEAFSYIQDLVQELGLETSGGNWSYTCEVVDYFCVLADTSFLDVRVEGRGSDRRVDVTLIEKDASPCSAHWSYNRLVEPYSLAYVIVQAFNLF